MAQDDPGAPPRLTPEQIEHAILALDKGHNLFVALNMAQMGVDLLSIDGITIQLGLSAMIAGRLDWSLRTFPDPEAESLVEAYRAMGEQTAIAARAGQGSGQGRAH